MDKRDIAKNRRENALALLRQYCGGNKTRFAKVLSRAAGKDIAANIIHRWFWENDNRRDIGADHARLIESAFQCAYGSLDLSDDNGELISTSQAALDTREQEIIDIYRRLGKDDQDKLWGLAHAFDIKEPSSSEPVKESVKGNGSKAVSNSG